MALKHIPKAFYRDHVVERDLPAPPLRHLGRNRYGIDTDHPDYAELVDDARHYATDGTDAERQLVRHARKLLEALGEPLVQPRVSGPSI